ncbi:hypothetical protein MTO96_028678 [Rhipicephalus appendiculatus]
MLIPAECSSCGDNERSVYCTRQQYVRQNMCTGVNHWPCRTGSWQCACTERLVRSIDGACVTRKKCDPKHRRPKPKTTKFPRGTYIPGGALKVLKSEKELMQVLLYSSRPITISCYCFESALVEIIANRKVTRTLSCRTIGNFGPIPNAMMKHTTRVTFELQVVGGHHISSTHRIW